MKRAQNSVVILFLLFFILFCCSAYMMIQTNIAAQHEKQAFDTLIPLQPHNAVLYDRNPDFFGWMRIEGTNLNYPVMHTPDDPERYLRRAFDGSDSQSGVPFLDADCFTACGNYLIYGHNMKNGTMFSSLLLYSDRSYWEQHPIITFDTLYESGEYTVLAAFYSEAYPKDADGVFRYYQYTELRSPDIFSKYMKQVQETAIYDTGVEATYGDQLLTLSTCSYHTHNGRFVVIARKMAPH